MIWVLAASTAAAATVAGARWLRVAQREHYLPLATRFAWRWWNAGVLNRSLFGAGVLGVFVAAWHWSGALLAVAVTAVGPIGLGLGGTTSPLAWTRRTVRLAAAVAGFTGLLLVTGAAFGWTPLVAAIGLGVPLLFDLVLMMVAPLERRVGERWVRRAAAGLAASGARVVAITGSYGKTSTKGYVAHLLSGRMQVVASPASFNNRMGLARAINEHLTPGTDVFVAEMGTYGRGEIAELCEFIPPEVAVITAIGPVHLERMGSEEAIVAAKREILDPARAGVLWVDHPGLAAVAEEESARIPVIRCSGTDPRADVFVDAGSGTVMVGGSELGRFDPTTAHAGNVACAVGTVIALGVEPGAVAERLGDLPAVAHRQTVGTSERGVTVIDDTYNANPAGAAAALGAVTRLGGADSRRVVVTPGLVELGSRQVEANRAFARAAADVVTDLVVVGRTNRRSLLSGAREGGLSSVIVVPTRQAAVEWVRGNLREGDVVLYENDLPDHYP